MKVCSLHQWDVKPKEAIILQRELAASVKAWPPLPLDEVRLVAGADISMEKHGSTVFAAVVVLSWPGLELVEEATHVAEVAFPYVPGLLAFREIPPLLECFKTLRRVPSAVLVDGHGLAHPRGIGIASHLGLWLNIPTIGCAKTLLTGAYEEPGRRRGSVTALVDKEGHEIGQVVRTKDKVKPVFVSVGHLIDLDSAVELTLACSPRYRLPEPTRQAHILANKLRSEANTLVH
ncbi:MAG: deoxyribonuclease V [Actinomycetota bacterium]